VAREKTSEQLWREAEIGFKISAYLFGLAALLALAGGVVSYYHYRQSDKARIERCEAMWRPMCGNVKCSCE
jgi:hypothetical protein